MKIQCTIIRDGGTTVDIGRTQYHFEPLSDGCHVANVENQDHIDRFLSISDGYKLYRGDLDPVGVPVEVSLPIVNDKSDNRYFKDSTARALFGSSVHEKEYQIGETNYTLDAVIKIAFEKSALTPEDWNDLDDDDRCAKIDIVLDDLAEAAEQTKPQGEAPDERAELVAQYKEKFGKAPHYRLSIDKLKEEIAQG